MNSDLRSLSHGSSSWLESSIYYMHFPYKSVPLYLGLEIRTHRVFVEFYAHSCLPHSSEHSLFSIPLNVLGYVARNPGVHILRSLCLFISVRISKIIRSLCACMACVFASRDKPVIGILHKMC
jgi:hypothetical protein